MDMQMAEDEQAQEPTQKKSKLPLLLGLVLMVAFAGAGFFAVYSGLLFETAHEQAEPELSVMTLDTVPPLPDVSFVPVEPLIINLSGQGSGSRHLRFQSQLEVPMAYEQEVASLMPRILDILNGYLRAVDVTDLERPAALIRLRAQILRRLQIVAGEGRIRDVLITEFVVN